MSHSSGDARNAQYMKPFQSEVHTLSIGIGFCVDGEVYTILVSIDDDRPSIGTELWYYLSTLTSKQWKTLETDLRKNVEWVGEDGRAGRVERRLYGLEFTRNDPKRSSLTMKALLERVYSHPAYALNMIAKGKLFHMIYDEKGSFDTGRDAVIRWKSSSILTTADYAYVIDFQERELRTLQDTCWITIPLFSYDALSALYQLQPSKYPKETLACIRSGPAKLSGAKSIPKTKARDKKSLNINTSSKLASSIYNSSATSSPDVSTEELNKELVRAAGDGDLIRVAKCIKKGADLNAKVLDTTALKNAAIHGCTRIVEMLLKAGADVHIKNKYGITALLNATCHGHEDIVRLLLENDANPDDKANITGSGLEAAVSRNRISILKLLLEYGAAFDQEALDEAIKEYRITARGLLEEARDKEVEAASRGRRKKKAITKATG